MERETKRILQLVLETMKDQHNAIRALENEARGATCTFSDGVGDRIERVAQQVRDLECFETDNS